MPYFCGVDTDGTFTDCVVMDEQGQITIRRREGRVSEPCLSELGVAYSD